MITKDTDCQEKSTGPRINTFTCGSDLRGISSFNIIIHSLILNSNHLGHGRIFLKLNQDHHPNPAMPKICQPRGKLLLRLNQLREGKGGTVGWSETHREERMMRVVRQQWIWIQVSMEKLLVIDGHKRCVTFSLSYVMTYH